MKTAKRLTVVVATLVLLLVAAVVVAAVSIDSIARRGLEAGGTWALGVPTTLKSADVGILSGTFEMSGLRVANPQGFTTPHFLTLGDGGVAVSLGTLTKETVVLPTLNLETIDVRLERQGGTSNYKAILDHYASVSGGSQSQSSGPEKKYVINELTLRDIKVEVSLLGVGGAVGSVLGEATKITVPIDEIKLKDVGKTGTGVSGTGVTMGELAGLIVQAVLSATVKSGGGLIPSDVLGDLQGQLTSLGGLKDVGLDVVANAKGSVEQLGKQAGEALKQGTDAVDKAKEAAEGLSKGVKDLLPKKN